MKTRAHPWRPERLRLASVEITRRCNNRCDYCDRPRSERDLSLSEFQAILDDLDPWGAEAVALGGGEPTLHPRLQELLRMAQRRGLRTGLTTNGRAPHEVLALADAGLLDRFGVSAGKGDWEALVAHPRAVTNLLLLCGGLSQLLAQATRAVALGAGCLLLLSYKGDRADFVGTPDELADAFGLLNVLGQRAGVSVAADAYTLRRLGLIDACGDDFIRVDLDGRTDDCCFPTCDYRDSVGRLERLNV
jgi:hypothetical protein